MNQAFQKVIAHYKPDPKLTHQQQVMRLYRKALRSINSWAENRDVFNDEADKIRGEFNANMNIPADSAKVTRLMREARERLEAARHPDPYITAYMPGGTLFMRNPAIPLEALYPDGIPSWVTDRRRINVDMSLVPDNQPYADQVLVDSASKQYWIDK